MVAFWTYSEEKLSLKDSYWPFVNGNEIINNFGQSTGAGGGGGGVWGEKYPIANLIHKFHQHIKLYCWSDII